MNDAEMTTSAASNNNSSDWCPDCDDVCEDHARICTVCGATLQGRPQRRAQTQAQAQTSSIPSAQETSATTAQLRQLLGNLRGQIDTVDARQQALLRDFQIAGQGQADDEGQEWQAAPEAAMDPSQSSARLRPTADQTLQHLPRIKLTKDSFIFRRASLSFDNATRLSSMEAIPGEFGSRAAFSIQNAALIVAQPRTGKGGLLLPETIAAVKTLVQENNKPVLLYMERGDNITFVAKALLAQQAGASALVVGNNTSQPWPYIMKDSKQEAVAGKLNIPVVMVKQVDGQSIVAACCSTSTTTATTTIDSSSPSNSQEQQNTQQQNKQQQDPDTAATSCRLDICGESKECVVCRDEFTVGQTVIQLPACNHVFHEPCATMWLSRHNTCPYCRRELPTDDAEYEQERRRTQRTHAGSESVAGTQWHTFYG
jgi:hypothetical protein